MNDTEFDLLCEGANPAEAKRLRKMLAEWSSGDENSFPVQLALLTKAQWRAVARLPNMVKDAQKQLEHSQASQRARFADQFASAMEDACRITGDAKKLLEAVNADHRRQLSTQCESTVATMAQALSQWSARLSVYNDFVSDIAKKACSKADELDVVSKEIRRQLKEGAELWNLAKGDFNTAREKMNEERERLEQRLTKRDWIAFLFLVAMIFTLGIVLGVVIRR
jgi:hypothetical protein